MKKGDVWVSAILYFGLGIVVITILLVAGLPVINKLRDKNIVIQTKEVMHTIDQNVREVIKEGPGSQRVVSLNIKRGSIKVDKKTETVNGAQVEISMIVWEYKGSKIPISEPNDDCNSPTIEVAEGKLNIVTCHAAVSKTYDIIIYSEYSEAGLQGSGITTLQGLSDLVIRNEGVVNSKLQISINEV